MNWGTIAQLKEARLEIASLRAELRRISDMIKVFQGDVEWRHAWHERLGRGTRTEGRFYEELERHFKKLEQEI